MTQIQDMIELIIISLVVNSIFFLSYEKISEIFSLYDLPDNLRKIHLLKIPNIGGFIFAINTLVFLFYSYFSQNFFNNWLNIITFRPMGIFLYSNHSN